ncbi:MAG: hypothetical protein IJV29_07090 [Butyrivibrio sp.]|nr:hypothetical protein [Butyrivibrio sp.]
MIIASHNSWSYLPVRHWWMRPFSFMAKCQRKTISQQYELGVRCFDLRIRLDKNDNPIVAHGLAVYKIKPHELLRQLAWLDNKGDVLIRLVHEVRTSKQYTQHSRILFREFCNNVITAFSNIHFWGFMNLYNYNYDYQNTYHPSCCENYSSVMPPKLLDDWYPLLYAKHNNREILEKGTTKDILMIDFVDIR